LKIYHLIARLLEINTIQFGLEPFTFLFHLSFLKVSTLFKKRQGLQQLPKSGVKAASWL
jgi:hypothetical protein